MKVFDYLDFNNFFEDKTKFDISIPKITQTLSFEEIFIDDLEDLMLEMAVGITPGSGTQAAVRLDDADIQYLYQFMPADWSRALWWRYGPGLIDYARTRHQNVPEHEDEASHFHGLTKKSKHLSKEKTESIIFDEEQLLEKDDAKLAWMQPVNFSLAGNQALRGKKKYNNITFSWNELYNKLNNKYKFAMQRVDDRYWHEKGQLPQLAGYKPMNFVGVDNSLNKYFKGLGIQAHHPENHHENLNNYQINSLQHQHGYDAQAGMTTNDTRSPHEIIPLGKGTHTDKKWQQGHPSAQAGTHELKDQEYRDHLYGLMEKGLGTKYSDRDKKVQPYYLGSPKPGRDSSYNIYETFGLHKALKLQNWELEKYFPNEFHQWAYEKMKEAKEGKKDGTATSAEDKELFDRISGISDEMIDISEDGEFLTKLQKQQFYWKPIKQEQVSNYSDDRLKNIKGVPYALTQNQFIKEAFGKQSIPKWQWIFLKRFVNRFNPSKTRDLTSVQHHGVSSIYKSIPPNIINDIINGHPELGYAHDSLAHKRGLQNRQDLLDREKEKSHGTSSNLKTVSVDDGFKLSSKYIKHEFKGEDHELPHADHTDVMVGGVWHTFGGESGNITQYHNKTGKWQKIPAQKVFVPLLHRGQVLPSEKQFTKGINLGSFGHSQVAEVETNHFGTNADDDKAEVSKETAMKYAKKGLEPVEKDGKYYINRNKHFWKAAEEGHQPDEEFFGKEANHNDAIRNTDHHRDHMKLGGTEVDKDRLVKYNTVVSKTYANKKPFIACGMEDENGTPILKSVHDGVQDAINDLKSNEMLVDELTSELNALWAYGTMLLKANVGHPQFFKNPEYEAHLQKETEDMQDDEGNIDLEAERTGISWQGTAATGFTYRKKRVKNYITSFSQRPLSDNIPSRRMRGGKNRGYVRGLEDHDMKRLVKTHIESMEQQEIAGKRKRGERRHVDATPWGLAEAQSSYHKKMEKFIQAQQESENEMNVKSAEEIRPLMDDAKSNNFAMLALWAIESSQVPQARLIAQNASLMSKDVVSEEEATSMHFPETHPHQYKKALAIQLEAAKKWAKGKQEIEWDERFKKSLEIGELYSGATSTIPNEDFIKSHSGDNVVDDFFNRTYEYDSRASVDLIKSELNSSNVGENADQSGQYSQIHGLLQEVLKEKHPSLFDFQQDDEEGSERFALDVGSMIDMYIKADEDISLPAVHAFYDFLLNEVDVHSIPSVEYLNKIADKLKDNATLFGEILENSPHDSVEALGPHFMKDLNSRLRHIKKSYENVSDPTNRGLNDYITSSVSVQHEAGKALTLSDFDEQIGKLGKVKRNVDKVNKLKGDRQGYADAYDSFVIILHENSLDLDSVKVLGDSTKETKQDFLLQALEDAFIDQTIKYLSHVNNWANDYRKVGESAKYLTSILGKDFADSFKNEFRNIEKRHNNAFGETA